MVDIEHGHYLQDVFFQAKSVSLDSFIKFIGHCPHFDKLPLQEVLLNYVMIVCFYWTHI